MRAKLMVFAYSRAHVVDVSLHDKDPNGRAHGVMTLTRPQARRLAEALLKALDDSRRTGQCECAEAFEDDVTLDGPFGIRTQGSR